MSARKGVYSSMTTPAQRNVIRLNIIERISIYMMNICSANFIANLTRTTSFRRKFFEKFHSIFVIRGIFSNSVRIITFFRTIFASFIFNLTKSCIKFFTTINAASVFLSFLKIFTTIYRTKFNIGMFKSRFKKTKFDPAICTISKKSRNNKSFISTFFRAKTLFLIFKSRFNYIKILFTNFTDQINSFFLKSILTFSRTKLFYLLFQFIRKNFKNFTALITTRFHVVNYTTLKRGMRIPIINLTKNQEVPNG